MLLAHIRELLPTLKSDIEQKKLKLKEERDSLGPGPGAPKEEQGVLINGIIRSFCSKFESDIMGHGTARAIPATPYDTVSSSAVPPKLETGARIKRVFRYSFIKALASVVPLANKSDQDILVTVVNAQGIKSDLLVPQAGFERLVENEITLLQQPVARCGYVVLNELVSAGDKAASDIGFFVLRSRMVEECSEFLQELYLPLDTLLKNLVNMERAYVDSYNPEFVKRASPDLSAYRMGAAGPDPNTQSMYESWGALQQRAAQDQQKRHSVNLISAPAIQGSPSSNGLFSGLFGRKKPEEKSTVMAPKKITPYSYASTRDDDEMSEIADGGNALDAILGLQEREQIALVRSLVGHYFDVVRTDLRDNVPKAIMLMLVNASVEGMQQRLTRRLVKEEEYDRLLEEDEQKKQRRKV